MLKTRTDLTISGTGTASGGAYERVKIRGVGNVDGALQCEQYTAMGVSEVTGDLTAKQVTVKGQSDFGASIAAGRMKVYGVIHVAGDCTADDLHISGSFTMDGLLNAEVVDIQLHGHSRVDEIGGSNITIRRGRWRLFNFNELTATVIEGDDIVVENTKAEVVRGKNVTVGNGCDIDLVEYSGELRERKGSQIGERRRV